MVALTSVYGSSPVYNGDTKYVTLLSQINLMEHFKRSTARDFRINGATLEAALRQESSEEEEDDDDENDDQRDEVNSEVYITRFLQYSCFAKV